MRVSKLLRSVAGLTALAALASCGKDSTGPGSVNPTAMATNLNTVTSTFTNNAAFQSLQSLAFLFPQYAATSALRATGPVFPGASQPLAEARRERDAMIAAFSLAPRSIEALFPANVLGKTLAWNTTSGQYEVDPAITGAPANGIRIRLYSVNPSTQQPTIPLQLLGYVELTDESTPQANKLGVLLKLGSTTIADYDITAITGTTTSQFTIAGYIVNGDGSGRVDFSFQISENSTTNAAQFQSTLTAQAGAQVTFSFSEAANGDESVSFKVSQGGNSIEILVTTTGATTTGQVKYNGTVVANISEDQNGDPVFTGANGHTLSTQDLTALEGIVQSGIGAMFGLLFGVFSPALVVFSGL